MRLLKARVQGFQSFSDSGDVEFGDGINLIIGQNNAGKSALLRSLWPKLADDRHRASDKWEDFRLTAPKVNLTINVSGAEIYDSVLRTNEGLFLPIDGSKKIEEEAFILGLFERTVFTASVTHIPNANFSATYPSHKLFDHRPEMAKVCLLVKANNGEIKHQRYSGEQDNLPLFIWNIWNNEMFYFAAERMTIGECPIGRDVRLDPNARNLPRVLSTLNNERGSVFQRLIQHLREIFPTVGNISVRTMPDNNKLEVRVWPTSAMERVELSFPLDSSGTGVAQAIAILTAVMTVENAVIIIDEINSFLHPAAVKTLLRILQTNYMQHQYIISTHAPEVIGFSNPSTIHLVKRTGYESSIERLNLNDVGKFREVAEHLGVSMADVFAADRVIWVEGPTEELCFPYLYQQQFGPLPSGTIITSVAATGDFNSNKRDPAIVYEVYQRLSAAAATLLVSVAFSFDTELLTDNDKSEMVRKAKGLLHFLPRRHLECYLVDPDAIAAFIIHKDPASNETVTSATVETALQTAAVKQSLNIKEWKGDIADVDWLTRVDAANLIVEVCGNLSEQRAPFTKKNDSLFLLKHMLENNLDRLKPLSEYVGSLVKAVTTH